MSLLQSDICVPVVHAHVFADYLKALVDMRTDISHFRYRESLSEGESQRLKGQFIPETLSKQLERVTGKKLAADGLSRAITDGLFRTTPLNEDSVRSWMRLLFTTGKIPVRHSTSPIHFCSLACALGVSCVPSSAWACCWLCCETLT